MLEPVADEGGGTDTRGRQWAFLSGHDAFAVCPNHPVAYYESC